MYFTASNMMIHKYESEAPRVDKRKKKTKRKPDFNNVRNLNATLSAGKCFLKIPFRREQGMEAGANKKSDI